MKKKLSVLITSVFFTLAVASAASARGVVTVPYDGDDGRYERNHTDYDRNYNRGTQKKVIIQKNNRNTKKVIIIEKNNHRNNKYKNKHKHNHRHIERYERNSQPGVEIKINLPIKKPRYY